MLGFRGHFLTKCRAYSITFSALRAERRIWRLRDDLDQLAADTDDPATIGPSTSTPSPSSTTGVVHIGHRDHAERELAARHRRTQPHPTTHHPMTRRRGMTSRTALYLTVAEAATYLNTSERFVRRLVAERRVAFHHVGRHVRIRCRRTWMRSSRPDGSSR